MQHCLLAPRSSAFSAIQLVVPAAAAAAAAATGPAPRFAPLGDGDWNDEKFPLDDGTKHVLPTATACEQLCASMVRLRPATCVAADSLASPSPCSPCASQRRAVCPQCRHCVSGLRSRPRPRATLPPTLSSCAAKASCAVGLYINGSVRTGECWIAARKRDQVRLDFCGQQPGQDCYSFQKFPVPPLPPGPPPPPSPPPPYPPQPQNSTVLQSAVITIALREGAAEFEVNVSGSLRPVAGATGGTELWVEYFIAALEWAGPAAPAFVHTPHLKRVATQHWGHLPSSEYVMPDRVMVRDLLARFTPV